MRDHRRIERVLVERVEGFAKKDAWQRAYDEINELERLLIDDGVRVEVSEKNEDGDVEEVTRIVDTTVGRALLSSILPQGLEFEHINRPMTKKAISNVINVCYRQLGLKRTVVFADRLMYTGFRLATMAGISIGVNDMTVPEEKAGILSEAEAQIKEIENQYASGLVTNGEHWMLVDAPKGETTGFASWYGWLWLQEPITLRAFRSLLSVERFFGVLLEHYAGAFPTWLAPEQVRVLPVAEAHEEYAAQVAGALRAAGARVGTSVADDGLGKRIRAAKLEKIPYVLVVGDDDVGLAREKFAAFDESDVINRA